MEGSGGQIRAAFGRLRRRLREPLLIAALAGAAGILLADSGAYHPIAALAAVALGAGFAIGSRQPTFLLVAVAGTLALRHDHALQSTLDLPEADRLVAGESLLVEVKGVVATPPKRIAGSSDRVTFFLTLTEFREVGGSAKTCDQKIYVVARADPPPRYGDLLLLRGSLSQPAGARNPGEFDFAEFLRRKGVIARLAASSGNGIENLDSGHGNPLVSAAHGARRWVGMAITRDLANRDPEVAGVLTAMTLGQRAETDEEIIESFRTSGTLHIFAVSGLHVGLIGVILWLLLTPLPIGRRKVAVIIIAVLCSYAFITGLRPSAVRAAIMASLILAGPLLDREPRVINSLGAAGFAILLFDSNQLFLPGFQLSFAVLLALTLLQKPIMALFEPLVSPDPFLPKSLLTDRERRFYRVLRAIASTFAVSIAAWLGSLPLMIYHFHLVTPIAPLANLLLIPAAFCVLGTAILSILMAGFGLNRVGVLLNNSNLLFAIVLTWAAGFFASLPVPLSHFYTSWPPAILRPEVEINVVDIGNGGASTLISTDGGEDWLIDTGNTRDFKRNVTSVLREHAGVTHIDDLLLTHADAAHIGGATDVLHAFRPERVYLPQPNRSSATYRRIAAAVDGSGQETLTLRQGDQFAVGKRGRITVVYAQPEGERPRLSDDGCTVLMLEAQGWRILFTGDAGFTTEQILLGGDRERLRADLIIRGEHASDHSLTPTFLDAVSPAAVISNARHHESESPNSETGTHLERRGIRHFDQAETGGVTIRVTPGRLTVEAFLNGESIELRR